MKIWNLRNFTEIKWREFLISHYCLFWALRVRVLANLRIKEFDYPFGYKTSMIAYAALYI